MGFFGSRQKKKAEAASAEYDFRQAVRGLDEIRGESGLKGLGNRLRAIQAEVHIREAAISSIPPKELEADDDSVEVVVEDPVTVPASPNAGARLQTIHEFDGAEHAGPQVPRPARHPTAIPRVDPEEAPSLVPRPPRPRSR